MFQPVGFTISVRNNEYLIQLVLPYDECTRFTVFKAGKYLFTLCMTEDGKWQTEPTVRPIDKALIEEMGRAIEEHYTKGSETA